MKKSVLAAMTAVVTCAALAAGCSASTAGTASATDSASMSNVDKQPLTVFAAASLNAAFPEIAHKVLGDAYDVTFSFEGSSTLVEQLNAGAPADVFASADEKNMTKATEAKLVEEPEIFASNILALIVPKGNPAHITGLDGSLDGAKLVVCAPQVPCGRATAELASQLGVTLSPVSEEQKVTDVRGKVESGEADAGLVYRTDAAAAGDAVETVDVAAADKVVNRYPIAIVTKAEHKDAARAFVDAVLSPEGQSILEKYGFTVVR